MFFFFLSFSSDCTSIFKDNCQDSSGSDLEVQGARDVIFHVNWSAQIKNCLPVTLCGIRQLWLSLLWCLNKIRDISANPHAWTIDLLVCVCAQWTSISASHHEETPLRWHRQINKPKSSRSQIQCLIKWKFALIYNFFLKMWLILNRFCDWNSFAQFISHS